MKHEELTQAFRDQTASPPVGAKERIWRGLEQPRPAARRSPLVPVFALAASMVLGIAVVKLVQSRRATSEHFRTDRTAILWNDARAKLDAPNHVTLETGAIAVSAWGNAVEIAARGHVVKIDAGLAVVTVANDSVTAEAVEGTLSFDGQPHVARSATAPSSLVTAVLALESDTMRARRLVRRAEQSVSEQRFEDAVKDLDTVASSGTLDAEVANFKKAELELRRLNRPEAALATLAIGDAKFATGALAQERQLTLIESLVKLDRWADVERNTSTFLTRFADSERADEVRRLHEDAARRIANQP
ncbi:MAG: hypothetical protein QM817_40375 [Archangium sp.]